MPAGRPAPVAGGAVRLTTNGPRLRGGDGSLELGADPDVRWPPCARGGRVCVGDAGVGAYGMLGLGLGLRAQAARAHSHLLANAGLVIGRYRLNVDVPPSPRLVVGVADVVSKLRTTSAELTFCHSRLPV